MEFCFPFAVIRPTLALFSSEQERPEDIVWQENVKEIMHQILLRKISATAGHAPVDWHGFIEVGSLGFSFFLIVFFEQVAEAFG
jgi:hypothetical protein